MKEIIPPRCCRTLIIVCSKDTYRKKIDNENQCYYNNCKTFHNNTTRKERKMKKFIAIILAIILIAIFIMLIRIIRKAIKRHASKP